MGVRTPASSIVRPAEVENIIGPIAMWNDEPNAFSFRPERVITLRQLRTIAELLGATEDDVELYQGHEDNQTEEREPGEITIYKPHARRPNITPHPTPPSASTASRPVRLDRAHPDTGDPHARRTERALPDFGDEPAHAFEAAVNEFTPIVDAFARRANRFIVRRFGDHYEDFRQAGFLGLHRAVTKYRLGHGMSMRSYVWGTVQRAVWKAEQELKRRGLGGLHNKDACEFTTMLCGDAPIAADSDVSILETIESPRSWALPSVVPDEDREPADRSDFGAKSKLAREHGLTWQLVSARLNQGWTLERALKTPKGAPPVRRSRAERAASRSERAAREASREAEPYGPPPHVAALKAWRAELQAKRETRRAA